MSQNFYPVMRGDEDFFAEGNPASETEPVNENPFDDMAALVRAARLVLRYGLTQITKDALKVAADNCETWLETDDPRANGWIDDKGRP